jgi:hypothetical protein
MSGPGNCRTAASQRPDIRSGDIGPAVMAVQIFGFLIVEMGNRNWTNFSSGSILSSLPKHFNISKEPA